MMVEYDKLKDLISACEDDVARATNGNKSAGTRVRKAMQEIKSAAQDLRKAVLEKRE